MNIAITPNQLGAFMGAQQWNDFASQIQIYFSIAGPKSGNHAEPRTEQHSTARLSSPT